MATCFRHEICPWLQGQSVYCSQPSICGSTGMDLPNQNRKYLGENVVCTANVRMFLVIVPRAVQRDSYLHGMYMDELT
jgi:hypothetical protein